MTLCLTCNSTAGLCCGTQTCIWHGMQTKAIPLDLFVSWKYAHTQPSWLQLGQQFSNFSYEVYSKDVRHLYMCICTSPSHQGTEGLQRELWPRWRSICRQLVKAPLCELLWTAVQSSSWCVFTLTLAPTSTQPGIRHLTGRSPSLIHVWCSSEKTENSWEGQKQ